MLNDYYYLVSSAFSSDLTASLISSFLFIFFFVLFCLFAFFSILVIIEEISPKTDSAISPGHNSLGKGLIIAFTFLLFLISLFLGFVTLGSMKGIEIEPQYLPRIIKKEYDNNLEEVTAKKITAYSLLRSNSYYEPQAFIEFKKQFLDSVPKDKQVLTNDIIDLLQPYFIECVRNQQLSLPTVNTSVNDIKKKYDHVNYNCSIEASKKLINKIQLNKNIELN